MDTEAVVNAAPLIEGGLIEREREIKGQFVEYIVGSKSKAEIIDADGIKRTINRKIGVELDASIVGDKLNKLESEGVLEHTSSGEYRVIESPDKDQFDTLFDPVWVEFRDYVKKSEYDQQIDYDLENIRIGLREFFMRYYSDLINELSDVSSGTELQKSPKFNAIIEEICEDKPFKDEEVFRYLLESYIRNQSEELKEFFGRLYIGVINHDLLTRGEYMDLEGHSGENKKLFLDTNILIGLLCESDNLHPLVSSLCRRSNDLGYDLYYLRDTEREMENVVKKTQENLSGFSPSGNSDPYDNQFIKDFRRREDIVSPHSYRVTIGKWKKILSDKYSIGVYEEDVNLTESERDVFQGWINELNRIRSDGKKSPSQINHDTTYIQTLYELRKNRGEGPLLGPFGVTNNTKLLPINNIGIEEKWDHGILIHPQGWLNYLIAFTPAEFTEDDESEIAKAVLSTASDFEEGLELEDYVNILVSKSNVSEENAPYLEEIILETPLSEELEKAAKQGDGRSVEELGYEIISGLDEYIERERETREQLKKASERVKEEEEAKKEERARRKQLEETIKETQGLEVTNNNTIVNEIDIEVTQETQAKIDSLIQDLRSNVDGDLSESEIPKPPEDKSDAKSVRQWLEEVNHILDTSNKISKAAKDLQPYVIGLLSMMG